MIFPPGGRTDENVRGVRSGGGRGCCEGEQEKDENGGSDVHHTRGFQLLYDAKRGEKVRKMPKKNACMNTTSSEGVF